VSDAVFRFAEKTGFPVFCWATRLTSAGEVQVTVTQSVRGHGSAIRLDEFIGFLFDEIRQIKP
jgi:hypothetical protein